MRAQPRPACRIHLQHARGGSTARGGARLDAVVRVAPPDTVDGLLTITEQGETISQNYGLRATALRTLERAFGVLGLATLARRRGGQWRASPPRTMSWRARLAARSQTVWRALCVDDRQFDDFFRSATPIDVIERMQIGSRSLWERTRDGRAGHSLDAVGVRLVAGALLPARLVWRRHGVAGGPGGRTAWRALRELYREWPLFTLLFDDIEGQLARTDFAIAERYGELASAPLRGYVGRLREEYARCREAHAGHQG